MIQAESAIGMLLMEASDAIIASTSLFRGNGEKGLCPALLFQALGLNAKPAVPALINLLEETNRMNRGYVAKALGAIGPSAAAAIPALAGLLEDKNQFARVSAAEALGQRQPRRRSGRNSRMPTPKCAAAPLSL